MIKRIMLLLPILFTLATSTAYCAITVSVTSTKIDVTSTGGAQETFGDVVTATNAVSAGTILGSGTSGDPYTIQGDRELEISSACKVLFEEDTYIEWNSITTSGRYAFDIASGSEIEIEAGVSFDWSGSSAAQIYNSFYGAVTATGTSDNRIVLNGMSRNYFYHFSESSWDYLDITNNRYSTGYNAYFSQYSSAVAPTITFTNIRMFNDSGNNGYGWYFTQGGMYANVIIDGFEVDGIQYGAILYGSSCKLKNGTIKNCVGPVLTYGIGNVVSAAYETSKDDTTFPTGRFQSMGVLEDVHFLDNDLGAYSILAYYNALLQVKDCTFEGDTYSGTQGGIYSNYGSVVLEYNNTYTNIGTPRIWGNNGTFLHTRKFDITVQDIEGNPLKDAVVSWVQGSATSKERWAGTTDDDGHVINVFDGSPVFVEKEETSAGVYQQWSNDTASGLCLKVTVDKYGYKKYENTFEMTEDKDITVQLEDADNPDGIVINNATINNATIG